MNMYPVLHYKNRQFFKGVLHCKKSNVILPVKLSAEDDKITRPMKNYSAAVILG